ncbi:MAG: DUF2391 family protein [Thermoplasmatota archaeon]
MFKTLKRFSLADFAQQMVGGFLLAGPFVVTEEVWKLAENLHWYHPIFTILIVFGIGYGALYKADEERDSDKEADIVGIPVRFISLLFVSYLSVSVLIFVFGANTTFGATRLTVIKVISIASVFSVIGAATADSVF